MDITEKRRSILRNRRVENSRNYAKKGGWKSSGLMMDSNDATISIEDLQTHLHDLSTDIVIEKHEKLIAEFKEFFDKLGNNQDTLLEMVRQFNDGKSTREMGVAPLSDNLLQDRITDKIQTGQYADDREREFSAKTNESTWNEFLQLANETGLSQKECITLSLQLFIDFCRQTLQQQE